MLGDFKGILFDLDGVLCVGNNPILGASEVIQFVKKNKIPFRIATNFTTLSRANLAFKMNWYLEFLKLQIKNLINEFSNHFT